MNTNQSPYIQSKITFGHGEIKVYTNRNDPLDVYFNKQDVSDSVGYYDVHSLNKRIKSTSHDKSLQSPHGWTQVLDQKGIEFLSKTATRTKLFKQLVEVTKSLVEKPKTKKEPIIKEQKIYDLLEAKKEIGMEQYLSKWLIDNGYATFSDNAFEFTDNFIFDGYGIYDSNGFGTYAFITESGIEFIKNRIKSDRESKLAEEKRTQLEKERMMDKKINDLIKEKSWMFQTYVGSGRYKFEENDLFITVKSIIAEVKLEGK